MGRGHPGVYRLWLQARDIDKADEDGMEGAAVYKGEVYVGAIAVSFRCIKKSAIRYVFHILVADFTFCLLMNPNRSLGRILYFYDCLPSFVC